MSESTGTPIEIILYDEKDEVKQRYTRLIVRWGILKRAIRMAKSIDMSNLNELEEKDVDAIAGLVVEAFGNQFSIQELDDGADLSDMVQVIMQIVNKAQGVLPNPPPTAR